MQRDAKRSSSCGYRVGRAVGPALAAFLIAAQLAAAQAAPPPSRQVPLNIDSAFVIHDGPGVAEMVDPSVIFRTEVHVPEAHWLRLDLAGTELGADPDGGPGSFLIITSVADGARQRLDATSLVHWNQTSAYFNGDTLMIELWAYPGTGASRVSIPSATAGEADEPESICDGQDNRTPFNDSRVCRIQPSGCTAWLITHDNSANRFLTAGHCITTGTSNGVAQFNVPLSTSGGSSQHPPPEYQYPIQQSSIQVRDQGQGQDAATFQAFINSNTGLTPRVAQRGAFVLASAAPEPSNQTLTIRGHGLRDPANPIPFEWSRIQKIHTGPYTSKSGSIIRHRVDTTFGNSGSPVTMLMLIGFPFPILVERAIGIHTHAGCTSTGGSNVGTAIEQTHLQSFLANPLGTNIPFSSPSCINTTFASNNQGGAGGVVYFDIVVGSNPIEVWGLDLNIRNTAVPGGTYTADVYITPGGHEGKESNAGDWMRIATGTGINTPIDRRSRLVLEHPFRLGQGVRYGIAIRLSGDDAGQAYTNGDGNNEIYSNNDLTIETGAATNGLFSGTVFSPRVFNGQLCYNVLPTSGQCLETLFARNNQGNVGGAVYFDVEIADVPPVRVTEMTINSTASAGTALSMDIYRHAGTSFGNQTGGGWGLIGSASGTAAGSNNPTIMTLDSPIFLETNSSQGIALVLHGGAHAYTNGTGFNEVHWNTAMRITGGSATNVPFTGTVFEPRVFNGSFCYVFGTGACAPDEPVASQSPPDQALGSRSSNTIGQQIADDFEFGQGMDIHAIKLWAAYGGTFTVPQQQRFVINIYEHDTASNGPGALVYSETADGITPIKTGLARLSSPFRDIYEFHIDLPTTFTAETGRRYWLSPLGDTVDINWAWQFSSDTGERRSRSSAASTWSTFTGEMSWELCGSESCYPNCDGSATPPILTVNDFTCFINEFAHAQTLPHAQQITHYANCDGSTNPPVLTVNDFTCFINEFAQGCP